MAKKINIGTVTPQDMVKTDRKISRDIELAEGDGGWTSRNKIHKDKSKQPHRKRKHKGRDF